MNMTIENKIAEFINAGTDLSERKLAEHFDVPRSVIRRVKANLTEYTVQSHIKAESEVSTTNTGIERIKEGIQNFEKRLASKSANKPPAEISMIVYRQAKGDFELFGKSMLGKSDAYIIDQFLRCTNKDQMG